VIPGTRSPAEVAQNVEIFTPSIPPDFWAELKQDGLLRADSPTS
jgi:D-threo-aldose 1-dehydrogenase